MKNCRKLVSTSATKYSWKPNRQFLHSIIQVFHQAFALIRTQCSSIVYTKGFQSETVQIFLLVSNLFASHSSTQDLMDFLGENDVYVTAPVR